MYRFLFRRGALRWALLFAAALLGGAARADFILFPYFTGMSHSDPAPDLHRDEGLAAVDVFYSADHGRLRLLGEVLASTMEAVEVERLQVGWLAAPDATLWLGRYHSPLGYWNSQFHHGAYLETAITRPSISEFDDHGGVLPMHLTGLLAEGVHALDAAGVTYALAVGAGPELEEHEGLESVNVVHIDRGDHDLGAMLRLAYRPDALAGSEIGAFAAHTLIPGGHEDISEIRQNLAGAFFNWEYEAARLIGEFYAVDNSLRQAQNAARSATFNSANVQGEYRWRADWTAFGRVETSWGAHDDAYLNLFSAFARQRAVLGVRYELGAKQALKLELSRSQLQHDSVNQAMVQWSAAFP